LQAPAFSISIKEARAMSTEKFTGGVESGVAPMSDHAGPGEAAVRRADARAYRADLRTSKRALLAILIFVVLGVSYVAQEVLVPLLVALLLALLLSPIVTFLERRLKLPRALGSLLTIAAVVAALLYGIFSLALPAKEWIAHAPATLQTIQQRFSDFRQPIKQAQEASRKIDELTQPATSAAPVAAAQPSLLSSIATGTPRVLEKIAAVLLLVYFFLSSGDGFLRRMVEIAPTLHEKRVVVAIAREVQDEMSLYLFTVSSINAGLGVATAIIMFMLGVPNPLLWGVIACMLNFAPYVGPACTGLALALAGFATFDTLGHALLVPAAFFALTTVEGQLITPTIIGRRLSLNPAVVFVWLMLWGWMWGLVGLLLAGPLLACFRIVCQHVESLNAISIFIGGEAASADRSAHKV
jgi:predicted PurR-regulated permease PerM